MKATYLLTGFALALTLIVIVACAAITPPEITHSRGSTPPEDFWTKYRSTPKAPPPPEMVTARGAGWRGFFVHPPKEFKPGSPEARLDRRGGGRSSTGETSVEFFGKNVMLWIYVGLGIALIFAGLVYYWTRNFMLAAAIAVPAIGATVAIKAIEAAPWLCVLAVALFLAAVAYVLYTWWRGQRAIDTEGVIVPALEGAPAELVKLAQAGQLPTTLAKLTQLEAEAIVKAIKGLIKDGAAKCPRLASRVKAEVTTVKKATVAT